MQKSVFLLFVVILSASIMSQSKSDIPGVWKSYVKAGNKPTTPSFVLFKEDGSFVWGLDSSKTDPTEGASKGKWEFTSENEIKIMFEGSESSAKYYVSGGADMLFKYRYQDINGTKTMVRNTDMSEFLQKMSNQ